MTKELVEVSVRDLLEEIHEHPRLNLCVPHGFELEELTVEERPNVFAPDALSEWSISAELKVPIVYTPDSSSFPLRASLPARRDNLDKLRAWITERADSDPIGSLGLRAWDVTPDEPPAPYLPGGKPAGPPAHWSVTARFEVF